MKKELLFSLAFLATVVMGDVVWVLARQNREVRKQYAASRASGDSLRVRFNTALASIAEIQDSLSVVLPSETDVLQASKDVERGSLTRSRKDQVLHTISDLNDSIRRSKEMIHRLEQRLNDRDLRIASLEKVITNLRDVVSAREQMIVALSARVEALGAEASDLRKSVEADRVQITEQDKVIEEKRREISTVYYLLGTKQELKELGVVQESGGLAGLGKSARLSGMFPEQLFTNLDTDSQTTIQVPGTRPIILSGQNNKSYQIVPISADSSEIRITDPQEFRKVRYLVIRVG